MRRTNPKVWLLMSACLLGMVCTATGRTIYVDADTPDNNDGSSWAEAYKYLQDALTYARSDPNVDEIRVAQGTYVPDQNSADPNGSGDREASFHLVSDVALRGGYAGFGEPDPNARDVAAYETILSGDLDGNDVDVNDPRDLLTEPTRAENSYTVCTDSSTAPFGALDVVIEGFTITGGNANGDLSGPDIWRNGGGMWTQYSWYGSESLLVYKCTFCKNSALRGGGISNIYHSSPAIIKCKFVRNSAEQRGGGIYNNSSYSEITDCNFNHNWTRGAGGGMANYDGSRPIISNCVLQKNRSATGGGMYNYESNTQLINCIFIENWASSNGGGMFNFNNSLEITNCNFIRNVVNYSGGGIYNINASPMLSNCILTGNIAKVFGGGMYNDNSSSPMFKNCGIYGNSSEYGGGFYNRNSTLELSNCIVWDNRMNEIAGSPIVNYSDIKGGWPGGVISTQIHVLPILDTGILMEHLKM